MEESELYEAALQRRPQAWRRAFLTAWTAAGTSSLIVFCWAEPFSARLLAQAVARGASPFWAFDVILPFVMAARAVLLVEVFGYVYHRFFQHLGLLTRLAAIFRRNQMFHWVHHMIIYPIGRFYRRDLTYVSSEDGIGLSWAVPGFMAAGLALFTMGFKPGTFAFIAAIGLYAKYVVDVTHSRFHVTNHPWTESRYFQWLERIHVLHHWNQRYNFTIVHPLMDVLFGTYLSPRAHEKEIQTALADMELTVSDLINWRYLLLEASPVEYAAFISQARRHPRSLRKLGALLEILRRRLKLLPDDAQARELELRASDLLAATQAQGIVA